MPIAELFLGALITTVFTRLTSPEMVNFACREGIESQLKKWSRMLVKIRAVLADAEHKQIRGADDSLDPINLWLQDLRDLAYDVDDFLDEFVYDALAKINTSPARGKSSKVHRLVRCFGACNPCVVVSNARMESMIKVFTARFQDIVTQQEFLRLSHTSTASIGSAGNTDDRGTSCVFEKSAIFGREEDKESLIQLLLQGRDQDEVGVIPIIGMGGLGKTTLAQLVYNDSTIEDYFPVRAWTCVSDDFNRERITISILESLKISPNGTDLNSLQVQLREALSGKKFLIILDDVWNEDYHSWDSLYAPFSLGLCGSMIIVTTRNEGVASLVRNISPYRLRQLSDDVCKSIFLRHALGVARFEAHQNLVDIGTQIAKRCKGLPLAAKLLGGILRNEKRQDQWQKVLESDIWDLPGNKILPVLKLSYHHLPSHLKQCFAYCSLFHADYEFHKHDLILLWEAEGFLQPSLDRNQKKRTEELGSSYFDDLTSRSFFQPSSTGSTFLMHDLVHELARHVVSDAYIQEDDHNATSLNTTITVRHFSFVRNDLDTFKRLEAIGEMSSLRTFLVLPIREQGDRSYLNHRKLFDLLLKLTRLRVLSLCGYRIKQLPDFVGELKHLRYLNMSGSEIEKLPDSVTSLFNLLTLVLRRCRNLKELPSLIGNLVKLQYLDLDHTPKLLRMPSGIKNLTGLRHMSKFIVGEKEELGITDLKKFSSLQGKLWITGLHNVVDILSAIHASLNSKDGLKELGMVWGYKFYESQEDIIGWEVYYESDDPGDEEIEMMSSGHESDDSGNGESERQVESGMEGRDEDIERQVLDHLQPPTSVQKLDILHYGGKEFPSWIGDPLCAPNIVRLRIDGCKRVTSLPSLGRLPLLKELTLSGLDGVTSVGDEVCGYDDPVFARKPFPSLDALVVSDRVGWNAFPSLEKLSISDMEGWEEWSFSRGLNMLRALVVKNCPKLMGKLPSHLPSLKKLIIMYCPQLTGKLPTHLPSIEQLQIWTCPQLTTPLPTGVASLSYLTLYECVLDEGSFQVHLRSLTLLCIAHISDLCNLNMLNSLPCLRELRIEGCSRLESFGQVSLPSTLKILELRECRALKNLPPMHAECFLKSLNIYGCDSLESLERFPVVEEGTSRESVCWRVKNLSISYCENKLVEDIMVHDIESLEIKWCSSLMCFPAIGKKLPSSLKSLVIEFCENLHTLTEGMLMQDHDMPWSLENLEISHCKSLTCFPTVGKLPTSLKRLTIEGCSELAAIPGTLPESSLEEISLNSYPKLEELPVSLVEDNIRGLVELWVSGCPALKWSNIPQGRRVGLPLNLKKLSIGKTLLDEDMSKWGLDCLTSLQSLWIDGRGMDDVISFPEYEDGKCFFLPNSLTSLNISNFNNLESLSNGLQELTFLKQLSIRYCPELRSLPSLPSTLEVLEIYNCYNVGQRCKWDWPSVSHIPRVTIDGKEQ